MVDIPAKIELEYPGTAKFGDSATPHRYPYFTYPMEGRPTPDLTMDELEEIVNREIRDYARDHKDEIHKIYTDEEKEEIRIVGQLMVATAAQENRAKYLQQFLKDDYFKLNFAKEGGEFGNTYQFGTFFETALLGLDELSGRIRSSRNPDIANKNIEVKTHGSDLKELNVEIGGITARGSGYMFRGLSGHGVRESEEAFVQRKNDVEDYLIERLEKVTQERNVVLFKVWKKMQNFLYIRAKIEEGKEIFVKKTRKEGGRTIEKTIGYMSGHWKIKAMVLYMGLLLRKLINAIDNTLPDYPVKYTISEGGWRNTPRGLEWTKHYNVEFRLGGSGGSDEAIKRQLEQLGDIYSARYDYINEVDSGKTKFAKSFFQAIQNNPDYFDKWLQL